MELQAILMCIAFYISSAGADPLYDEYGNEYGINEGETDRFNQSPTGPFSYEDYNYGAQEKEAVNCSGVLDALPGVWAHLNSPGYPLTYPENLNCTWAIFTDQPNKIRLEVEKFDTETCCDLMQIHGAVNGKKTLRGPMTPQTILSESNSMTVTFVSDSMLGSNGFKMRYTAVEPDKPTETKVNLANCGNGLIATSVEQIVTSPGFPSAYPSSSDCQWTINPIRDTDVIMVDFFELETEACCDYIEVFEGEHMIKTLRGNTVFKLVSTGFPIKIQFLSDESVNKKGFQFKFRTVTDEDIPLTTTVSTTRHVTSRPTLPPPSQAVKPVNKCEDLLGVTESVGVLTTPGWPNEYSTNLDCVWNLTAPAARRILLKVNVVRTEACCDYLEVYNGREWQPRLKGSIHEPIFYISTGSTMQIRFYSDETVVSRGFELEYKLVPLPTTTVATTQQQSVSSKPKSVPKRRYNRKRWTKAKTTTTSTQNPTLPAITVNQSTTKKKWFRKRPKFRKPQSTTIKTLSSTTKPVTVTKRKYFRRWKPKKATTLQTTVPPAVTSKPKASPNRRVVYKRKWPTRKKPKTTNVPITTSSPILTTKEFSSIKLTLISSATPTTTKKNYKTLTKAKSITNKPNIYITKQMSLSSKATTATKQSFVNKIITKPNSITAPRPAPTLKPRPTTKTQSMAKPTNKIVTTRKPRFQTKRNPISVVVRFGPRPTTTRRPTQAPNTSPKLTTWASKIITQKGTQTRNTTLIKTTTTLIKTPKTTQKINTIAGTANNVSEENSPIIDNFIKTEIILPINNPTTLAKTSSTSRATTISTTPTTTTTQSTSTTTPSVETTEEKRDRICGPTRITVEDEAWKLLKISKAEEDDDFNFCRWCFKSNDKTYIELKIEEVDPNESWYLKIYDTDTEGFSWKDEFLFDVITNKTTAKSIFLTNLTSLAIVHGVQTKGLTTRLYYRKSPIKPPYSCNEVIEVSGDKMKKKTTPDWAKPRLNERMNCTWKFVAPKGDKIHLVILDLAIEEYGNDYLKVADNGIPLATFISRVRIHTIISQSHSLTLEFYSKSNLVKRGLMVMYIRESKYYSTIGTKPPKLAVAIPRVAVTTTQVTPTSTNTLTNTSLPPVIDASNSLVIGPKMLIKTAVPSQATTNAIPSPLDEPSSIQKQVQLNTTEKMVLRDAPEKVEMSAISEEIFPECSLSAYFMRSWTCVTLLINAFPHGDSVTCLKLADFSQTCLANVYDSCSNSNKALSKKNSNINGKELQQEIYMWMNVTSFEWSSEALCTEKEPEEPTPTGEQSWLDSMSNRLLQICSATFSESLSEQLEVVNSAIISRQHTNLCKSFENFKQWITKEISAQCNISKYERSMIKAMKMFDIPMCMALNIGKTKI